MNKKELKNRINTAFELGKNAFANGLKSIPYLDSELLSLLTGMNIGDGSHKIMKSWINGWTSANLNSL